MNRPRGLCWTCYYAPDAKERYPSTSKFGPHNFTEPTLEEIDAMIAEQRPTMPANDEEEEPSEYVEPVEAPRRWEAGSLRASGLEATRHPILTPDTSPEAIAAAQQCAVLAGWLFDPRLDVAGLSELVTLPVWSVGRRLEELGLEAKA